MTEDSNMIKIHKQVLYIILLIFSFEGLSAQQTLSSRKRERNYIKEGNELFRSEQYSSAEVAYKKALEENPASEIAKFNLAAVLLKKLGNAQENEVSEMENTITGLLSDLAKSADNQEISEKAFYDLGNMAFRRNEWQKSIEMYKNTLRKNPDNDEARDNLRLAQLKLEEQQNQDQNKDQNQDQDQQDQNQQNQQDKQDQDNQQNQDQDQNRDKQDQNGQQQPQDQQQQQQQQQQSGISDRAAEQALNAIEKKEEATRKKIEAQKAKEENSRNRNNTDKPW